MQRVITINLNGQAYQFDEDAYDALRAYLNAADRQLAGNPDRAEIVADLEQAIADKCHRYLGPAKTVVTLSEINEVLTEMGPVDSGASEPAAAAQTTAGEPDEARGTAASPRRLYRINEGAMFAGVCNGLAAYFGLDVSLVRAAFVIVAVLDGTLLHAPGLATIVYLVLMFVLPEASTSEERAAASGAPFNAHEVIEQAKKNYAAFRESAFKDSEWKRHTREWKKQHREWRRQWRRSRRYGWAPAAAAPSAGAQAAMPYVSYTTRVWAGTLLPLVTLARLALLLLLFFAVLSLLATGSIGRLYWPGNTPIWAQIFSVFVVYLFVSWPLRVVRSASYHALGGAAHAPYAAFEGILTTVTIVVLGWLAFRYVPEVREIILDLPTILEDLWDKMNLAT